MPPQDLTQLVIDGDDRATAKAVTQLLQSGVDPPQILAGLQMAMAIIGEGFRSGERFVPEVLLAARAMQRGMDVLRPQLALPDRSPLGTIVIGTVAGDLHDIGKNLVAMMLEGVGFRIVDLGTDVKPEEFLWALEEHQPDIVAMSALLSTTMTSMAQCVAAFCDAGTRDRTKILVGGAPVTARFADSIGADGYAEDAGEAVLVCRRLVPRVEKSARD